MIPDADEVFTKGDGQIREPGVVGRHPAKALLDASGQSK
jgi:hypothetical protein